MSEKWTMHNAATIVSLECPSYLQADKQLLNFLLLKRFENANHEHSICSITLVFIYLLNHPSCNMIGCHFILNFFSSSLHFRLGAYRRSRLYTIPVAQLERSFTL